MDEFRTIKGYDRELKRQLSSAMEDYLEMIYRMSFELRDIKICDIAHRLNVKPPSVVKIARRLQEEGYIQYNPGEHICLTGKGIEKGAFLLERHNIILEFLCTLNKTDTALTEAELIEHYIDKTTLYNIRKLTELLKREELW